MPLTDAKVKTAKPTAKAYRISDGHSMYLWVTPSGGKLWRWAYTYAGKEKLMSFGAYPEISLSIVRERLAEARRLLATGFDPMAERKVQKAALLASSANSFETIAELWLEHWKEGKSLQHVDATRRRLHANILPFLGTRPISEIQAPEIKRMAQAVEQRGASDLAKRALEATGQIFRYAIANGYVKTNPAKEFKPGDILKASPKTNLARIDAEHLPDLLKKIEVYPGTHITRLAMKLMAHTFVRTTELIGAEWKEFDLRAARWNIPAERMKMRNPHIVPLSTQAIDVLVTLHQVTGTGRLVFPGERDSDRPMSNNTILKGLERIGYKRRMTGHGFRGLASTILHEQGYDHEHIELQLAHVPRNAVSAAYNHALYLRPRAKMMQHWGDFLEKQGRGSRNGLRARVRPTKASR
ncbi:MAG TPA: integrase arm-type DNA-binding domain-containing protein [Edaphobacter sp.]|jgi:integrase|nr:integrase arm-type DNA-binding domain-containing protein [Edaphobacter sp.]